VKKFAALFVFFNAVLCFAGAPNWLFDLEKEFPSQKFIRAIGEGKTESLAKNAALCELAAYFGQQVESNLHASQNWGNDGFTQSERSWFLRGMSVASQAELFCVRFSQCYFDKRQEKHSVCAYINKDELWSVLERKANLALKDCDAAAKIAIAQSEPLRKIILLNKAQKYYQYFCSLWHAELCVYPKKSDAHNVFARNAAVCLAELPALKKMASICVIVNGDKNGCVRSKICQLLNGEGLAAASNGGAYTLRANVVWNQSTFGGVCSAVPQIQVAVTGKNGLVASFAGGCDKVGAYNKQTLDRLSVVALQELLDERFVAECFY